MIRIFFCFVPLVFFAASTEYSSTAQKRMREMHEDFTRNCETASEKYFTGSWNQARCYLAEKGIQIGSVYAINIAGNPLGGKHQAITQVSSWGSDFHLDFGKKTSLQGLHLYLSFCLRFGQSLSNRKIGNQFNVQQLFGSETIKVISLYLQQNLFDDRLLLRFGRMSSGDEFNVSPLFHYFMNNGFNGNPIVPNFNLPYTAYPNASWGFYTEFFPAEKVRIKLGAYNGNSEVQANKYHGLNFTFRHPEGYLFFGEAGYLYDRGGCYPGNYLIGAGYSTERKETFLEGKKGRGNYELYIQLDQKVHEYFTPFFTFLYFPDDRNLFPYFFLAGLISEGMIPKRPKDSISCGIAFGQYSKDLKEKQKLDGLRTQHSETDFELNYKAWLTDYFYLQPNLQYILWPSGYKSRENAFVIGLQSALTF